MASAFSIPRYPQSNSAMGAKVIPQYPPSIVSMIPTKRKYQTLEHPLKLFLYLKAFRNLRYKPVPCSQSCNDDNTQHFDGKNVTVCDVKPEDQTATLPIAAQGANADERETAGQRIEIINKVFNCDCT